VTLVIGNLRTSGAIVSDRRGQIEIDRSRLAAAACECHGTMRLEVEQIFAMNTPRSRVMVMPDDRHVSGRIPGGESGEAV
jgi:hypothetical protein